jgi:hypothetical protein
MAPPGPKASPNDLALAAAIEDSLTLAEAGSSDSSRIRAVAEGLAAEAVRVGNKRNVESTAKDDDELFEQRLVKSKAFKTLRTDVETVKTDVTDFRAESKGSSAAILESLARLNARFEDKNGGGPRGPTGDGKIPPRRGVTSSAVGAATELDEMEDDEATYETMSSEETLVAYGVYVKLLFPMPGKMDDVRIGSETHVKLCASLNITVNQNKFKGTSVEGFADDSDKVLGFQEWFGCIGRAKNHVQWCQKLVVIGLPPHFRDHIAADDLPNINLGILVRFGIASLVAGSGITQASVVEGCSPAPWAKA